MIERRIQSARGLHAKWSGDLSREKGIMKSLEKYRGAIPRTFEHMLRAGVARACSFCAAGPAGSCCFESVEDWYDDVLLLINLLLGVELPEKREIAESCFFVGGKGCRLLARHAFCVNYLCPALIGSLEAGEKRKLLSATGEELLAGWELEKKLRPWLKKCVR
jgi:hypothetical protein